MRFACADRAGLLGLTGSASGAEAEGTTFDTMFVSHLLRSNDPSARK